MTEERKTRWVITEVRDDKGNIIKDHPYLIDDGKALELSREICSLKAFLEYHKEGG